MVHWSYNTFVLFVFIYVSIGMSYLCLLYLRICRFGPEEVWNGDITIGVKPVWNVITADKYSIYRLRGILLPHLFEVCTGTSSMDALKVQSPTSNTTLSRVQVHLLSEGPTRGLGVCLTSRLKHFHSMKDIKTVARFNSTLTDCLSYYGNWKLEESLSRITWCCHTFSGFGKLASSCSHFLVLHLHTF